jgi:hypothetical protein
MNRKYYVQKDYDNLNINACKNSVDIGRVSRMSSTSNMNIIENDITDKIIVWYNNLCEFISIRREKKVEHRYINNNEYINTIKNSNKILK